MLNLIKPNKLNPGDKVATVSLSWGGVGDDGYRWRYEQGKQRLIEEYGLNVVEMNNTLKGSQYLYEHPEKRAEDLMQAFSDKTIKGIINCTGGEDSIRIIPYIDYNVIKGNPKVFTGYSDATVTHFICMKAGIMSYYGPELIKDFSENVRMDDYTDHYIRKTFFDNDVLGDIPCSVSYAAELVDWNETNKYRTRYYKQNTGYELVQGSGTVSGHLIGGCLEVVDMLRATPVFPSNDCFDNSILFIETSGEQSDLNAFKSFFRSFGAMGILRRIKGILFGKPYDNILADEYKSALKMVLAEYNASEMPVLFNASFGHNDPRFILPYGAVGEIDCENKMFRITESGVK